MRKISPVVFFAIFLTVLFGYPWVNGLGCNFNYHYSGNNHDQFASCKLGQYTFIDYPDPKTDNGYTVLRGLYFKFLNNAVVWETSREDHVKHITPASMTSINNIEGRTWHQVAMIPLTNHQMAIYQSNPKVTLQIVHFKGRLALF